MTIFEMQTENMPQKTIANSENYRLLCNRLDLLEGDNKLLMSMHFKHGNSFRQIAKLMHKNERNISRRINNLSRKLLASEYFTCLHNRDLFSIEQISLARDYFLLDMSVEKIAVKHNLSCYRVRQILRLIDVIIRSIKKNS